jgi:hypothetical protein
MRPSRGKTYLYIQPNFAAVLRPPDLSMLENATTQASNPPRRVIITLQSPEDFHLFLRISVREKIANPLSVFVAIFKSLFLAMVV